MVGKSLMDKHFGVLTYYAQDYIVIHVLRLHVELSGVLEDSQE